jgi:hypothetical protein
MTQPTIEQRLIQYLVDNEVDFAQIGRTLAKEHAELFLGIVEGTLSVQQTRMRYANVLQELRNGEQTKAIREFRIITNYGLKTAVDVIRYVGYRLLEKGVMLPFREDEIQRLRESGPHSEVAIRAVPEHFAVANALYKAMA